MFKVYLAGPISGLTYDQGQDWRQYAVKRFAELSPEIKAYSPLRAKEYLRAYGQLEQGYEQHPLSSEKGITTRDRNDASWSDLIIFNLLGAKRVSIGTCIEIGWADSHRVPMVLVIEKEGNPHDYPIIREVCGFRTDSLDDGINIARGILLS